MIRSYIRTTFKYHSPAVDTTPQQWYHDQRCEHCENGQNHSQWAHEDAIAEYNDKHNLWED